MSAGLNAIKSKIASTQSMHKITKAMQMISAAKLTKAEAKHRFNESYMDRLQDSIRVIVDEEMLGSSILFEESESNAKTGYLVITSDRGLAGGYNSKVLKLLEETLATHESDDYKLYLSGKKAFDYAKRNGLKSENDYLFLPDGVIYSDVMELTSLLVGDYVDGKIDKLVVIYHHYHSKLSQEPNTKQILPLSKGLTQKEKKEEKENNQIEDYIFEPNKEEVAFSLLVKSLNGMIYQTVLQAKLSEHAMRRNAMQNATDNAEEIIDESKLIYNRIRQAAITQEINEIVGGAAALKK